MTFDANEADFAPVKLNDLIARKVEIGATIPAAPGLLCIDSHASFDEVQREGFIVTGSGAQGNIVHELMSRRR